MMEKVFKAYDVRGIYPDEINEDFALKIGKAFGSLYKGKIVVGRDVRLSSFSLKKSLIKGLISTGCNVIDIGIVSTPMLIFSSAKEKCNGIMITASHLPKEYNGFKFYQHGIPIYGRDLEKIKEKLKSEKFLRGKGKVKKKRIFAAYSNFLLKKLDLKKAKMKVVVDAGNGVAGIFLPKILRRIGIEVHEIFCEPNGNFPNRIPEPTRENLDLLKEKVVENNADLGLAFDGDCDRVVFIDEKGNIAKPEQIFGILIKNYLKRKKGKVVYETLTSSTIPDLIKELDGMPIVCRVGHVFVQNKVVKEKAIIGGEISGHYYFSELPAGNDDAFFASLKLIECLLKNKKSLSECCEEIKTKPYEMMRIEIKDGEKFKFIEKLKKEFKRNGYEIDCLEGVKILFPYGWALFRASQTESKISVAYEANDEKDFNLVKKFVEDVIKKIPK